MIARFIGARSAAALLAFAVTLTLATGNSATATTPGPTAVQRTVVVGHSVLGRPIVAYLLGDPAARTVSVLIGEMHGDEHAGVTLTNSLIHGTKAVGGVALWVIPTMNPDGDAKHTRQNAHGVDLNRNFSHNWKRLSGQYYSGSKPFSEPESAAVARFLRTVHPRFVVSLHQPLDGVDTTAGSGPAYTAFRQALGRNLGLPQKAPRCWSVCYGSMSSWFRAARLGVAVETVEFGWHPATSYLTGQARRGIVAALGGHFGSLRAHDPQRRVHVTATTITGWALDPDLPRRHVNYRVTRDGRFLALRTAWAANDGGHGIRYALPEIAGRHRYCVTVVNLGAGTGDPVTCTTVRV